MRARTVRRVFLPNEHLFEEEGGAPEDFEFSGTVIPENCLEYDSNDYGQLEGFVSDERLTELGEGAEVTEEERKEYRRRVISQVEEDGGDSDVIHGYWVRRLEHTDGREVFALETVTGYSFSGVENTFHGLFQSVGEALKDLSTWGVAIRG